MTRGDLAVVQAGFWLTNAGALFGVLGAVTAALITGGFALWQVRRTHRFQAELEQQRREFEGQRLELEAHIDTERRRRDEELQAAERRRRADAELQARLAEEEAHADEIQRQAVRYRRAVIAELRNLKILDMTKPLDLEALYVQVQVRDEEPVRYATDEEIVRLSKHSYDSLVEPPQPPVPVEDSGVAVSLSPEEALRRFHRIALLGDPGAGKTTLLRHLTFRIARGEITSSLTLPVYVELRRFADSAATDLVEYVAAEWNDRYGFAGARPHLERELEAGRCALLLDGLDEVYGGSTADEAEAAHRRISAEIDRLASRFPAAPMAVTCRRAGWRGKLPAFRTLEVLDFSWRQVQDFVTNWFEHTPARGEGLARALASNLRMQTLAANPLLLSLIAIVYERNLELPERRAELYRRCVEVLLREWDSHREIRRYSEFTTDRKRNLLEEVAWHFHQRGVRYFRDEELLSVISRFLPTIDIDRDQASAVLEEIATQYGLLKVQAHGWYGFLHLTLQEYFAAVAAGERGASAISDVVRHRHDPWWEEVLLLLAGRTHDASALLLGILGHDTDAEPPQSAPLAVDDDVFHGDVLLAARCLASTPRIRTPWLRPRIVAATRHLLLDSSEEITRRRAAQALVELRSRTVTEQLVGYVRDDHRASAAVCRAFGKVGDHATAAQLLELLQARALPSSTGHARVIGDPVRAGDTGDVPRIARALGEMRYRPAAPVMLRLLDGPPAPPERVAAHLVRALGALGDRAALPTVMRVLREEAADGGPGGLTTACADALTTLGTAGTAQELVAALRRRAMPATAELVRTIVTLDDGDVAPILLECLLDTDADPESKPQIAAALAELPHPAVIDRAAELVHQKSRPWWVRYLLTLVLAGDPGQGATTLTDLLGWSDHDARVRVGAAATLAAWQRPDGLPLLREALIGDTGLPKVTGDAAVAVGGDRFWHRIAAALRSLGDHSVVPHAVERFQAMLADGWDGSDPSPELLAVLEVYRPEEIGERLFELLESHDAGLLPSRRSVWALHWADKVLTPELLPQALSLVEHQVKVRPVMSRGSGGSDPGERGETAPRSALLDAVAARASDEQTVRRLQRLARRTDADRDVVTALDKVCRRGRLRVFPDGRVVPIRTN
ncbi:MAG: NACHT domain-containing protein [Micromonosporaceae bacterium]